LPDFSSGRAAAGIVVGLGPIARLLLRPRRGRYRRRAIVNPMSVEPGKTLEPPMLPAALLEVWPVIAVGALAWLVAAVAAFVIPALETWRPLTLAGLAVGLLGTSVFLWQRDAARRGARGAQTGLQYHPNPPS
jgi:hypothetical protein